MRVQIYFPQNEHPIRTGKSVVSLSKGSASARMNTYNNQNTWGGRKKNFKEEKNTRHSLASNILMIEGKGVWLRKCQRGRAE